MRPAAWLLVALALVVSASAAGQDAYVATVSGSPFVRAVAGRFVQNGASFRFLGANVAVMHGDAHRAALGTTLDAVRDDGLHVIRVWALGEREADAPAWARSYAFRIGEEGWVEESFAHLDRVLVEAASRHLSVIVVLANRWADYGGVPAYLRWTGDPFDASAPDGIARADLGTFFRSARARELYLAHVERVVGRTNALTGVPYRDDPTLFAWELMNEVSAERRDAPDLAAFVSTAARRIHELDPHHMVSAGEIGYASAAERRTWREIVSLPEIDYADAHAYPAEHDRVRTRGELDAFVDDHAAFAQSVLHRPLLFGELGFAVGRRALGLSRPALFDHFLGHADRVGVDGALVWTYVTASDRAGGHTILADHPDAEARRVRTVLARHAREMGRTVPSPDWGTTDVVRWDPSRTVRGTPRIARSVEGRVSIAPEDFFEARFEAVGAYDGGAIAHVYGSGHGYVTYRFRMPAGGRPGGAIRVSVRASSELPGRGEGARAEDGSRVLVSIDDELLGGIDVPPDDGTGRVVDLEIPVDPELGAALAARRTHLLRFEVEDDDRAHGLCFYGAATGHEVLDPVIAAELPGRVEVAFLP